MTRQSRHPLDKAAEQCGLEIETIVRFVQCEWIIPIDWANRLLDEEDLARLRLIRDLQEVFGVNDEAIPIILHLIDRINCDQQANSGTPTPRS